MATTTTQTTGRRKEAIARARLRPGTGVLTVNGRPFESYFTTPAHRMVASEPLRVSMPPSASMSTQRSPVAA